MAGAMRKMAVYLGLVEDEAELYDDIRHRRLRLRGRDHARRRPARAADLDPDASACPGREAGCGDGRVRRSLQAEPDLDSYRITTLHPRNYNDARTVGEYFRESTPVIMNLTDMEDADAKRLVDFAAGLVFAVHGTIERVTAKVFLLSPANVVVTAEEKARLAEGGFFNQS